MYEQILNLVKQHIGNNPQVSSAIPKGQEEAVHREIAGGVQDGVQEKLSGGGLGGMLSSLMGGGASADISTAISRAVASRLNGKFGLSPSAIQQITSAIPGIINKVLPGK